MIVFLAFILMLSVFLGFEVISKVPSTLHTPLMSGSNAISGITLLGALVAASVTDPTTIRGDQSLNERARKFGRKLATGT